MDEIYRQYLQEGQRAGMRYRLLVPRNVPQGIMGARLGRGAASSLEFMDYREYQPGDDLRRIDWSAFARSDKLTLKLYREEVNPHVDIIIDGSLSMALVDSAKARATLGLAAVFTEAAAQAGYTHCGWLTRGECERIANGSDRADVWDKIDFDARANPGETLARRSAPWRTRGIRVFLSDLFWMGDPLMTLSLLRESATLVIVVQVLSETDVNPPQRGNVRLLDSETGQTREIFVDASAQKRYRQRLAQHQQNWHRCCGQVGALMTTIVAEEIVKNWKLDHLVAAEILKVN